MTTLFDFDLTEDGDIQYTTGGDIALIYDEDALRQQVMIDVNEVVDDWKGGGLNSVSIKGLQQSIEDRLRNREYSDAVSITVVGVNESSQTVVFEGEVTDNENWRFNIDL